MGIVTALPLVHVHSRLFSSELVSPPFGERGSIISASRATTTEENALLARTSALADELVVDFVSLRGRELTTAPEYESRRRFVTFQIPVGDEESMRENMKDSRSRQIRQASENEALSYEEGESLADIREYYQLYLQSVRGHGTPPHSFEFYKTIWNQFADAGHLHLGMVRRNGELIKGIINFAIGETVYQWGVVTDYQHRDLNGGSYLVWKSLQWASQRGYNTYELGRTREGSGVYMFKKSFGGKKTWYKDYHYFPDGNGELPHPESEDYETLKKIWQRLPISVTRLVGPSLRQSVTL